MEKEYLLKLKKGDTVGDFVIEHVCFSDNREYNRAFLLRCKTCNFKIVKSYKQLLKMEDELKCAHSTQREEVWFGDFIYTKFDTYTVIESNKRNSSVVKDADFIVVDNTDLNMVLDTITGTSVVSAKNLVDFFKLTDLIFKPKWGILFRNMCPIDLRHDNVVLPKSLEDYNLLKDLQSKDSDYRKQFNYTARTVDKDGFSHGIVYHIASITTKGTHLDFYYDSDLSAGRKLYELEQEYCINKDYALEPYNLIKDMSKHQNYLYSLLMQSVDWSYVEYLKLCDLADDNPLSIIRYGYEEIFKSYGIPCEVHFDANPYRDRDFLKHEEIDRINDIYVCCYHSPTNSLAVRELRRCIVGKNSSGEFNLYKINGTHEKHTFNEAIKLYGAKTSEYNTKDGVKPEYKTKGYVKGKPFVQTTKKETSEDWLKSILGK